MFRVPREMWGLFSLFILVIIAFIHLYPSQNNVLGKIACVNNGTNKLEIKENNPNLEGQSVATIHHEQTADGRCLPELAMQDDNEFHLWDRKGSITTADIYRAIQAHPEAYIQRIIIHNGTIFHQENVKSNRPSILTLIKAVCFAIDKGNPLPTLDLLFNEGDYCVAKRDSTFPLPIWSWSLDFPQCTDFSYPYWSFLWYKNKLDREGFPKWEERMPKLIFRGSPSGGGLNASVNPRVKVIEICQEIPEQCNAGFYKMSGKNETLDKFRSFLKGRINASQEMEYRYQLLIDGNGPSSSRSVRLMRGGSVVFKLDSWKSEFWYPLLQPFVNYIPVSRMAEDLKSQLSWALAFDRKAHVIAQNGERLFDDHLTSERVTCWFVHKLRRYGKLMESEARSYEMGGQLFQGMTQLNLTYSEANYVCNYGKEEGLFREETCRQVVSSSKISHG